MKGLVIKNTGSWYLVKTEDGRTIECKIKGNFRLKGIRSTNPIAVGDYVQIIINNEGTAFISEIEDRKNYIIRRASNLSKQSHILAANLDQCMLIVTINYPETSTIFIDRFLATAEAYRVPVKLIFNKTDRYNEDDTRYMDALINLYTYIGYPCFKVSALNNIGTDEVKKDLEGKVTLLSGNSGVGKSTLINAILPEQTLKTGEIAAIMGPNGTGKSTLSAAIMGNPSYEVTQGEILFDGVNILELEVDERARMGLFLAMQYPSEIPGITNAEFLRAAMNAGKEDEDKISVRDFITKLDEKMELLNMKEEMAERYLNEGFSGGEKKRNEILQLLMLEPTFALLDEIDSGLDIDALKVVSKGINAMRGQGFGAMIITHYQRLLNYITPDVVHVMMEGRVVLSGGPELAQRLENEGYVQVAAELGIDYKEDDI